MLHHDIQIQRGLLLPSVTAHYRLLSEYIDSLL
jgi:hypothetical protein